ncbi:MAG: molybdenum cofactor guanylyltransferase [Rhodospirillales bacterium]|jgi:molybdopterin-guanine dinucleotide biosynthesis protein A|nr:molybdenum cofactor guanylyltransferase [Rhodospirillales bacterium]MBT4007568.1 molybdenum cofactor guanylyltransferase [Rhodospirillales bacterium]MBT5077219.1 molybdenum cofactor guanylyltransferase [Rhodospirillales bacterium]MBT5113282.1 molybdenum cofactor guanylyltransferase [Rhodospirillales bacterium]MBT5671915.1 molybdenum cofactor guanylyltransferase [Rhodospirillales bacterium]
MFLDDLESASQGTETIGLILAGGRSSRFGNRDKCFELLGGRPLIDHVLDRANRQVGDLLVSSDQNPERFKEKGIPVIPDGIPEYAGPLAGLLSVLDWMEGNAGQFRQWGWIATFPVDSPFFPEDMVDRLMTAAKHNGQPVIASSNGRAHPVFGLWPRHIRQPLRAFIDAPGRHRLLDFSESIDAVTVSFKAPTIDPFFNINTPDDLECANQFLADGCAPE